MAGVVCGFQCWWVVGFDFDYDFFRLIGYVVVVNGWVCSGRWWLGLWW